MNKDISKNKLAKNITLSMIAQLISLFASFILGLILPKYISEYSYSYVQMYTLYASYVGMMHFGLLDGLILRYAQYDYDQLDKERIKSQFQILLFLTSFLMMIGIFLSLISNWNSITKNVVILVAISIVTKNILTYTLYTFQLTNRIKMYASTVIIQRAIHVLAVILLLVFKIDSFYWYCLADLFGDIFGIVFGYFNNKGLYFGKSINVNDQLKEAGTNISVGMPLLIANLSSQYIIGGGKMIIQWRWDTLTFGKISFAFSISTLFANFMAAASVAIFPSLKRMGGNDLVKSYTKIHNILSPLSIIALLFYFPGYLILQAWLPKYSESLIYVGILLPIIIFLTKVNLLTNNYLKAYRKEKELLLINVISVTIAFALYIFGAYYLNSLDFVLFATVGVTIMRSIISEWLIMKLLSIDLWGDIFIEVFISIIFILSVRYLSLIQAFIIYSICLAIYIWMNRKSIKYIK